MTSSRLKQLKLRCDFDQGIQALEYIRHAFMENPEIAYTSELFFILDFSEVHVGFDPVGRFLRNWEITVGWREEPTQCMPLMSQWLRELLDLPDDQTIWIKTDKNFWTFLVPSDGLPRTYPVLKRRQGSGDWNKLSKQELRYVYRILKFLPLLTKADLPAQEELEQPKQQSVTVKNPFLGIPPPK